MKNIAIIGGDNRNVYLSSLFKESGYVVNKSFLLDDNGTLEDNIENSNIIIIPMPVSMDNIHIYTPLSDKKLKIYDFIKLVKDKIVIGGKLSNNLIEQLQNNNNEVFDLMDNEELVIKNTIPTAEGIVKLLIENTDIALFDSNIAVLGFGRVGKRVAYVLDKLGAKIFGYDIKKEEVANIKSCSYNVIEDICSSLGKFDIIINTIPEYIISKKELDTISKGTFLLDVASNPGGFDHDYAKTIGLNSIHALGIPGKIAPKTSAKYIKEIIEKLIIWGVNNVKKWKRKYLY